VGVSGAQRSGSAQHRSAPTARTERRQAAREAALFWQTGDEAEREALLSSPPLALRACLVLSLKLWSWTTNLRWTATMVRGELGDTFNKAHEVLREPVM